MIVELIVNAISAVVSWIVSLFPTVAVPSWLTSGASTWRELMDQVSALNGWFPVTLAVSVAGLVLASFGVGLVIKVVRIIASFVTAGGGSAG